MCGLSSFVWDEPRVGERVEPSPGRTQNSPPRRSGTGCWVVRVDQRAGVTGVTVTALPFTNTPLTPSVSGHWMVTFFVKVLPVDEVHG